MESVDQIIQGKWLITCEEDNAVLENHALIIHNGKIKAILPSHFAKEHYTAPIIKNYSSHAIIPGLINAHTHIPMTFFRGLADDLALIDWLNNHIWPAEKKWLSPEFVYDASLFAMAEMIRSGTTCFNDMFFFMPSTAKATEIAGLRGHISIHVITFPTNWAKDAAEEFTKGLAFYEEYKTSQQVTITICAHSMYTVTADDHLLKVKEIAEKYNLKINMHVQEPHTEIDLVFAQTKLRPLQRLEKLGLLSPRLIAIHALHLNEEDLDLLQTYKPNIVHCPQSNMKLASGICPVSTLRTRGVNVALGTDGAASNNDLNMLDEMRSATLLSKHFTQNPASLSAAETLQMATLNGAKALGIDHITGSLKVGKAADFVAINLEEIETLPIYHPVSQIVYAASRNQVTDVWVAGKQLLENRKLTTLDENELIEKAKYWGEKIKSS
jgi:5-methylthioadenosine/S-adenosylhomocysteine deaminase